MANVATLVVRAWAVLERHVLSQAPDGCDCAFVRADAAVFPAVFQHLQVYSPRVHIRVTAHPDPIADDAIIALDALGVYLVIPRDPPHARKSRAPHHNLPPSSRRKPRKSAAPRRNAEPTVVFV